MEKNKVLSMLGLARRAGRLSMGHDTALKSLHAGKAKMLLFACDSSERLRREFQVMIEKNKISVPVFILQASISEIHYSCGYKAGVITVDDENFSKKIISLLQE